MCFRVRTTPGTPPVSGAVLFPSTPCSPSTSTPTRTAGRSRAAQRAWRTVSGSLGTFYFPSFLPLQPLPFLFISAVEERVGSSQVQGRLYLNKVFHISASKMFELLFSDSNFMRRFFSSRKILSKSFADDLLLFHISCQLFLDLSYFQLPKKYCIFF